MNAILIIGLPGSGKTHLAKTEFVPAGYWLIDDPKSLKYINDGVKEASLNSAVGVVITDPNLVYPGNVYRAVKFLSSIAVQTIDIIYFENDWRKAKANLERRNKTEEDRGPINVEHFSKLYVIPDDIMTREICQASPDTVEETNHAEDIT